MPAVPITDEQRAKIRADYIASLHAQREDYRRDIETMERTIEQKKWALCQVEQALRFQNEVLEP